MYRICDTISAPTITSAAAATSSGTIWVQRGEEHRDQEQHAGDDVREPGAGALADAGAGVDEDRVRRGGGRAAGDGADALDDEGGLEPREVALLVGEAGLLGQARSWCPWRRRSS